MPYREWQLRVQDILQSVIAIEQRTVDMSFEEFQANEILIKAVLYDFIIIGEASINIPDQIQTRYPSISWRLMSDMRNVIAHEYFQVKLKKVWQTIHDELPLLVSQLEALLQNEGIS